MSSRRPRPPDSRTSLRRPTASRARSRARAADREQAPLGAPGRRERNGSTRDVPARRGAVPPAAQARRPSRSPDRDVTALDTPCGGTAAQQRSRRWNRPAGRVAHRRSRNVRPDRAPSRWSCGLVAWGCSAVRGTSGDSVVLRPVSISSRRSSRPAVRTPARGAAIALLQVPRVRHESRRRRGRRTAAAAQRSRPSHRYPAARRDREQRDRRAPHAVGRTAPRSGSVEAGRPHRRADRSRRGGPIGVFKVNRCTRGERGDLTPFAGVDRSAAHDRHRHRRSLLRPPARRHRGVGTGRQGQRADRRGATRRHRRVRRSGTRDAMLALVALRARGSARCRAAGGATGPRPSRSSSFPLVVLGLLGFLLNVDAALPPSAMKRCRRVHAPPVVGARRGLLAVASRRWAAPARRRRSPSRPRNPYHVTLDAQGQPVPFTIVAAGFPAGSLVYVEQCDAQPPSAPNWSPTRNCDIGTSPPAASSSTPSGTRAFAPAIVESRASSRSSGRARRACSAA